MKKIKIVAILNIIFLVLLGWYLISQSIKKPRIFIVHSYATDFAWVSDMNTEITRILGKHPYNIRFHYMDTKHHTSEEFKIRAGNSARRTIESWQPDIIVAIDDNAQHYVGRYYIDHSKFKVVFAGVNKSLEAYGYLQAKNVTGILERINFQATKNILIDSLTTDKRRLFHVSDNSPTSEGIHDQISKFDWHPFDLVASVRCDTFTDWQAAIKKASKESDIVLLSHYHTIKNGAETMKPGQVIEWTNQNCKLPGIGFWGFYVEDGGMMAVAVSPDEQGEVVAKLCIELIENQSVMPSDIPVITSNMILIYLRESVLKQKADVIKLPWIYEAFARATNNYYE
jgi:ABC-type uncharacterized transport system substrate-binding protein